MRPFEDLDERESQPTIVWTLRAREWILEGPLIGWGRAERHQAVEAGEVFNLPAPWFRCLCQFSVEDFLGRQFAWWYPARDALSPAPDQCSRATGIGNQPDPSSFAADFVEPFAQFVVDD